MLGFFLAACFAGGFLGWGNYPAAQVCAILAVGYAILRLKP